MANTSIDTYLAAPGSRSLISNVATRVGAGFRRMAELTAAAQAARYAGKLVELSDEQLAARGLTRDGIVAHAFRHLMYR